MMTPEQITKLIATGESETLEFKETTGTRRQATQTLCAMLNHRGGRVLFGVTPEGHLIGQQVSDDTVKKVSAEIQRIEPPVFPTIECIPLDTGLEVLMVSVSQGPMKPYTYKPEFGVCEPLALAQNTISPMIHSIQKAGWKSFLRLVGSIM